MLDLQSNNEQGLHWEFWKTNNQLQTLGDNDTNNQSQKYYSPSIMIAIFAENHEIQSSPQRLMGITHTTIPPIIKCPINTIIALLQDI